MKTDYKLKLGDVRPDGDIEILADDDGQCLIATVYSENCAGSQIPMKDAKRIVKAWNCHDDLAEALLRLLNHCVRADKDYDATSEALAALLKAGITADTNSTLART